ncbi:MAG: PRC-barrel domain-containing protein [Chloroflexota bacterium]
MRLHLDAKVQARDGEDIGSVGRAVVDPHTNQVTHIVVRTGAIFGRDITVPREDIERGNLDGDTIQLDLTKDELEQLPDFVPERYGAPPPTWVAPAGYGFPDSGYVWPIAVDPTIGPTPMLVPEELLDEEIEDPDMVTLTKGALVLDRHSDDVGVVDDVRFEAESGRLLGFVLRVGGALRTLFGGGDTVEVARHQIESIGESVVTLRLSKDEIEAATKAASHA